MKWFPIVSPLPASPHPTSPHFASSHLISPYLYGHTAVLFEDEIYIFGGKNTLDLSGSCELSSGSDTLNEGGSGSGGNGSGSGSESGSGNMSGNMSGSEGNEVYVLRINEWKWHIISTHGDYPKGFLMFSFYFFPFFFLLTFFIPPIMQLTQQQALFTTQPHSSHHHKYYYGVMSCRNLIVPLNLVILLLLDCSFLILKKGV
jgi:hypothetical protein